MSSSQDQTTTPVTTLEQDLRNTTADRSKVAPGEIAVGVVIGRASEYFDFFVFGIASVLVFPYVFFPFLGRLEGMLAAFIIFSFPNKIAKHFDINRVEVVSAVVSHVY